MTTDSTSTALATTDPVEPGNFELVTGPLFGNIPIANIVKPSYQPRQSFHQETLEELSASIKLYGINQALLFRPVPGQPEMLELVSGERRLRAAIIAGLTHVPGMVKDMTDEEVAAFRLIENMQREDVAPLEEAEGIRRLMEEFNWSVEAIGEKIGKKRGVIYASLKLLDLSPEARSVVNTHHIAPSTALLAARIPVAYLQAKAINEIATNNGTGEPMSTRAAKHHIEAHYMLRLDQVEFDPKDAKLTKECGSCTECPKRTGNNAEDFAGLDPNICTDPDCLHGKIDAHRAALVATAAKRKIPVLDSEKNVEQHFPRSEYIIGRDARWYNFERVQRDGWTHDLVKTEFPKDAYPKAAGYFMADGKPEPIYLRTAMQEALEKAGFALTEEQYEALQAEREREQAALDAEAAEQEKNKPVDPVAERNKLILAANVSIAAGYNAFHADLFEEIKEQVAPGFLLPIYRALAHYSAGMAARSGELGFSQGADESYSVDFQDAAAVAELLEGASDEDVCRIHLDTVLSGIPSVSAGDIDGGLIKCVDEFDAFQHQHYETLSKIGGICGIDVGLLRDKHLAKPLEDLAKALAPAETVPAKEEKAKPAKKPKASKAKVAPQQEPAGDAAAPEQEAATPLVESTKTEQKRPARPKAKKAVTSDPAPAAAFATNAWPFPTSKDGA